MKNRVTEIIGTEYPIVQGGMAWVADGDLAAAVSMAGGLGVIAAGSMPGDLLRGHIRNVKSKTDKPFGVNVMLLSPTADEVAKICIEEKVPVITTGAGSPAKYIDDWKAAGIKVMPVIASPAHAKRMERIGADAVIAEGMEAGGHIGSITTMNLIPQVVDAVTIPVIAAGGIADARGAAAALALGAEGVQMGTVFICSNECNAHNNFKELIIKAKGSDTIITGNSNGHPVRSIKTKFSRTIESLEKSGKDFEEIEKLTLNSLKRAVVDGSIADGSFMAGQSAGLVNEIRSCAEIIKSVALGFEK